jgi:hypothetical protein
LHAQIAAPACIRYPFAMQRLFPACLCLGILFFPPALAAQEAASQPFQIGPSGEAYLTSLGYRRIETEVAYYDPAAALPALQTGQKPPAEPEPTSTPGAMAEGARYGAILISVLLLIGVAVLVLQVGGGFTLSLQRDAQNPVRARRDRGPLTLAEAGPPADLHAILTTSDRRRALVLLVQAALARTVAANGVLLQPSWTLRDALRHIPRSQAHLEGLRKLVMAGEGVLFGNRDVSEEEFQAHVAAIRPLMAGPAA